MGQRLNIEIVDRETSLANCYYHWSAYTCDALRLTKEIVDAYYDSEAIAGLKMAIDLLEATGGGVDVFEKGRIREQAGKFGHLKFKDCSDRNKGLLSVTEIGKEETRNWEEGRVTIDLSTETFSFEVLSYDTIEDYTEFRDEDFNEEAFEKLPECPFDLCRVPFDKVDDLIDFVENNDCARVGSMVLHWII